ncbi:DegT/DnrJ/EryC1/StrS family aminotransferase [Shimia sp. Alg240-R146]|uniref:DegT/DnrJ/EryC1/StrS family aminotransferase n=1 Tax=Shimia sp. Alg240-R146 TaxID=2993449 RepID=UPI0022E017DE|nr:DegT/DnrJ/EryC1/StrS family aminotransferase [Shimia sp. Alg240-R146]
MTRSADTIHTTLSDPKVPVSKPRLPTAQAIMPYLECLDQSRIYSNLGPVSQQLQKRLGMLLGVTEGGLSLTSSGSTALIGAILARAGRAGTRKPLAICPSYTFVATVSAIQCCGYTPYLVDVARDSWTPDPEALHTHPRLDEVGLVVITAPFGRVPDLGAWANFSRDTGVPVVMDAAASFDVLLRSAQDYPPDIPIALSFHATKAFGCGEGGGVLTSDPELLERAVRATNNGFYGTRQVTGDNINGKMSEYHACVAMAALDDWAAKLWQFQQVASAYHRAAKTNAVTPFLWIGGDVSYAYSLFESATPAQAFDLRHRLANKGIDSRFWYGFGLHAEPGFGPFEADPLPVTHDLSRRLLGIPYYCDMPKGATQDICATIAKATAVSSTTISRNVAQL